MKNFIITMVRIYQKIPGNFHNNCRFRPTCSNYMIEAIETYGSLKGTFLGIKRIIRCNPFNKNFGYDPVPQKELKNEKKKKN